MPSVLDGEGTVCGVLDPVSVREALPDGSYSHRGLPVTADVGDAAPGGMCWLDDEQGRRVLSLLVEPVEGSMALTAREDSPWLKGEFAEDGVEGRSGYLGAEREGGWAQVQRENYVASVQVHTPAEGRDGADTAARLVRELVEVLEQR